MTRVRIRVLGPWRIETPSGSADVSSPLERSLLLMLAAAGDAGVSDERMFAVGWGPRQYELAYPRKSLERAVQRLRRKCGDDGRRILTYSPATGRYRLDLKPDELDYRTFLDHCAHVAPPAGTADGDDVACVADHQIQALQLWTTHWSDGLPDHPEIRATVDMMDEMRMDVLRHHIHLTTMPTADHIPRLPLHQVVGLALAQAQPWPLPVRDDLADLVTRADDEALDRLLGMLMDSPTHRDEADALLSDVLTERRKRA